MRQKILAGALTIIGVAILVASGIIFFNARPHKILETGTAQIGNERTSGSYLPMTTQNDSQKPTQQEPLNADKQNPANIGAKDKNTPNELKIDPPNDLDNDPPKDLKKEFPSGPQEEPAKSQNGDENKNDTQDSGNGAGKGQVAVDTHPQPSTQVAADNNTSTASTGSIETNAAPTCTNLSLESSKNTEKKADGTGALLVGCTGANAHKKVKESTRKSPVSTTLGLNNADPLAKSKEPLKPLDGRLVEPTEEPLEPSKSLEPAKSLEPTEPSELVKSLESTESIETVKSIEPVKSLEPTESIETVKSLEPVTPLNGEPHTKKRPRKNILKLLQKRKRSKCRALRNEIFASRKNPGQAINLDIAESVPTSKLPNDEAQGGPDKAFSLKISFPLSSRGLQAANWHLLREQLCLLPKQPTSKEK